MATNNHVLYDIRDRNYPNHRGDEFRSLQVFKCWVCEAMTNRVIIGGYLTSGVRVPCPHSSECWHHEIEEKVRLLNQPHPQSYKTELQQEIEVMKRQYLDQIINDIVGDPDFSLTATVTNVRSHKIGSACKHFLDS